MKNTPWVERFAGLGNRETLRALATRIPPPLRGLGTQPVEVAVRHVFTRLTELFYCSEQSLDILQLHIERAIAHCELVYPNMHQFIRLAYSEALELDPIPPICLTGLAGCGKSQMINAIMRVMPPDSSVVVEPCKQTFPMRAAARMVLQSKPSLRAAMSHLLPPGTPEVIRRPRGSSSSDLGHGPISPQCLLARGWSYRRGLALQFGDELQFVAQSSQASTRLVQVLLNWFYAVVPLTYALNFSAYRKLLNRSQEDRDRLLSHVIVVHREQEGSKDWIGFLNALGQVLNSILGLDLAEHESELNQLTAGLKRATRNLLIIAYRTARRAGRRRITVNDVRSAYRSTEYSAQRKDVEDLNEIQMSGWKSSKRLDLWIPESVKGHASGPGPTASQDEMDRQAARALAEDSLTPPERQVLRRARDDAADQPRHRSRGGKILPFPERGARSARELLRNSVRHREANKPRRGE